MKEQNINAYCSICGKGYHMCHSCSEQKSFRPWRSVTDSMGHYKIYMALHKYTMTKDFKSAFDELSGCDLSEKENFLPEINSVIDEIISKKKQSQTSNKPANKKSINKDNE